MTDVSALDRAPNWEPHRALTLAEARKRSHLVAVLRRAFVGLAGASLASVFVFMALSGPGGGFLGLGGEARPLQVTNPRFTGATASGRAYQITADTAVKETAASPELQLAAPVYRTIEGHTLVAPRGIYDETQERLRMDGGVLFSDASGNRFSSPSMDIDLNGGRIVGTRGVTGAGPLGVVRADAYEIRNSDRALVLHGRVSGQVPARNEAAAGGAPHP